MWSIVKNAIALVVSAVSIGCDKPTIGDLADAKSLFEANLRDFHTVAELLEQNRSIPFVQKTMSGARLSEIFGAKMDAAASRAYDRTVSFLQTSGVQRIKIYRELDEEGKPDDTIAFSLSSYFEPGGRDGGTMIFKSTDDIIAIYGPDCIRLDTMRWYACYIP
ncbi:MAG: hypothetical protein H7Z38_17035 [Rubrivivax sp.]|nr:hypothetical protein [Pyrinomonadaceae bacterium]